MPRCTSAGYKPIRLLPGDPFKEGGYMCPVCLARWPGRLPDELPRHEEAADTPEVQEDGKVPPDAPCGRRARSATSGSVTWVEGKILINSGESERGTHQMSTFEWCPQLHSYLYILCIPRLKRINDAIARGSMVHTGAAHLYARKAAMQKGGFQYGDEVYTDPEAFHAWDRAVQLSVDLCSDRDRVLYLGQLDQSKKMVEALNRQIISRERRRILLVEKEVRLIVHGEPGEEYLHTMRLDVGFGDPEESVEIEDHKTSAHASSAERDYWDDRQIVGFHRIGRALWGDAFRGVALNVISSVGKATCRKVVMPRSAIFERRFKDRILDSERRLKELLDSGRDPWNWPTGARCRDPLFKGTCPARRLCWQGRKAFEADWAFLGGSTVESTKEKKVAKKKVKK